MSEILAPCGTFDALTAAVNTGADAVYLGGQAFNARMNAQNFSYSELVDAVKLCKYNSVKVYVTVNTLIYDNELKQLGEYAEQCAMAGADGIIVQDIGAARLIRQIVPDIPLHASTQMTVNSLQGALQAKELGFSRVVLGRELSYEQIANITRSADIETEVFIHGALCVCLSGQCYMSAMFGGRSANRGECAQPCRLGFSCGERSNVLSLKDLSLIKHIKLLQRAGVTSFKIEGRMKRPEYVAAAVSACRAALNGEEADTKLLRDVFSRSGFTDGYFTDNFHNMQGIRTKQDVDAAPDALSQARKLYSSPYKRYVCDMHADVNKERTMLTASADGITVSVAGRGADSAVNRPLSGEELCAQLNKLGGTVYSSGNISADIKDGLYLKAAEINALRREALDKLSEAVFQKNSHSYNINKISLEPTNKIIPSTQTIRCEVNNSAQLKKAFQRKEYEYIYAPMDILNNDTLQKDRIIILPPVFLADCEAEITAKLAKLREYGYDKLAVHTLSHIRIAKNLSFTPFGTFRLNILNSLSLSAYADMGIYDAVMSPELSAARLPFAENVKRGLIAYGGLPLMITRRCPINDGKPCGKAKSGNCPHFITDRRGRKMKCICCENTVEIINPDVLYLGDIKPRGADFLLMRFTDEENIDELLDGFINGEKMTSGFTRGLYRN